MKNFATASIVVSIAALSASAQAAVTIQVVTALAPNAFGSPSYNAYVANAEYALQNGLSTYGSGPSQFSAVTGPIDRKAAIVTNFNSWLGDANPVADFGAAYSGELGNRLSFPLDVKGNGTKISISELSLTGVSSGDSNGLGSAVAHAAGSYNYGFDYVGINYGLDGVKGTGDDVIVSGGSNTTLVDEIVGRGSGVSYSAVRDGSTDPSLTNQDLIDASATDPDAQWNTFTGTYTLDPGAGGTAVGSASFSAVPEPSTLAIFGLGAIGLLARRRRVARA